MFYPRRSSDLINKVKERALRITCNVQLTNFKSLLSNHNEPTIHQRNMQILMTEIYKITNHIALPIMSSLFEIRVKFITQDIFKSSVMKAGEQ